MKNKIRLFIKTIEKRDIVVNTFKHRITQNFYSLCEIREKELFNIFEIDNNIYLFNKNKKIKVKEEDLLLIEKKETKDKIMVKNCVVFKDYLINKKTLNFYYLLDLVDFLEKEVCITEKELLDNEKYLKELSIKSSSPFNFFKEALLYILIKKDNKFVKKIK